MRIITSLSIERLNQQPSPLWGDDPDRRVYRNLQRLLVIVAEDDDLDGLVAYGVDPDHLDPACDEPVFERRLVAGEVGMLLQCVVDGGTPAPTTEPDGLDKSVDVPIGQPAPSGPKMRVVFRYARAMHTDELVAQLSADAPAATTQDPPQPQPQP
jgi:hypothetical protein